MSVFQIRYFGPQWQPTVNEDQIVATSQTLPTFGPQERAVAICREPEITRYWTGAQWSADCPAAFRAA